MSVLLAIRRVGYANRVPYAGSIKVQKYVLINFITRVLETSELTFQVSQVAGIVYPLRPLCHTDGHISPFNEGYRFL